MWGDAFAITSPNIRHICQIALHFRDFFGNHDWYASRLPSLDIRVSLHQGRHLQGQDHFTGNGWVFGQTINRAARIEPITKPGEIWVTEEIALGIGREQNAPFFADHLGPRSLAKDAGEENIYVLKRLGEPRFTQSDIKDRQDEHDGNSLQRNNFEVAIGIVMDGSRVVIVRPRSPHFDMRWQFPAGTVKPNSDPEAVAWREVRDECKIICRVIEKIGERVHPAVGVKCHYFLMEPISGRLENGDPDENEDVTWIEADRLVEFLGPTLYGAVQEAVDRFRALQ